MRFLDSDAQALGQPGQHGRHHFGQIFRDEPRPVAEAGIAMQPHRRAGRLEGWHSLRQKAGDEAAEDVPGAGRAEIGRAVGVDRGTAIRWAITVSAPFNTTVAPISAAAARARATLLPSSGTLVPVEQAGELAGMGGQHGLPAPIGQEPGETRGIARVAGERIGIEDQTAPSRSSHGHPLPGRLANAEARPSRIALRRSSDRRSSRSSGSSQRRSMIAVSCAAFSAIAGRGENTVTRPAPIRKAPRAARRAAPVREAGRTTPRRGRGCICALAGQMREGPPQSSGPLR